MEMAWTHTEKIKNLCREKNDENDSPNTRERKRPKTRFMDTVKQRLPNFLTRGRIRDCLATGGLDAVQFTQSMQT